MVNGNVMMQNRTEILEKVSHMSIIQIYESTGCKDCGRCGYATCSEFASRTHYNAEEVFKCPYIQM